MPSGTQCHNRNTEDNEDQQQNSLMYKVKIRNANEKCWHTPHLIPIPAHHVKNIEDPIGVAIDTVKDGVTVSHPTVCSMKDAGRYETVTDID